MKKELPKIYHSPISKPIHNNKNVFYGSEERTSKETSVEELFQINQVYRTNVKIKTKDKVMEKKVIGRTQNNLITFDNEIIAIADIENIELL